MRCSSRGRNLVLCWTTSRRMVNGKPSWPCVTSSRSCTRTSRPAGTYVRHRHCNLCLPCLLLATFCGMSHSCLPAVHPYGACASLDWALSSLPDMYNARSQVDTRIYHMLWGCDVHVPLVCLCFSPDSAKGREFCERPKWHAGLHQLRPPPKVCFRQRPLHPVQKGGQNVSLCGGTGMGNVHLPYPENNI